MGEAQVTPKSQYRVPLMSEIETLPWNGYTVASTFSGCGGSCLGYRMAGFKVLWANEFVEDARRSYIPNHPGVILDPRSIRDVNPKDILKATGLGVGDLDLFDGSPPCQSFSMAGRREKGWGEVTAHGDGSTQVSDDLFFEYARVLKGLQPKTFVAENVAGLTNGVAKGYLKEIFAALEDCGYRVQASVLDASLLGVPQARRRIIFVGVRNDLNMAPVFPVPKARVFSVVDACPWMTLPNEKPEMVALNGFSAAKRISLLKPSPTILAGMTSSYLVGVGDDPASPKRKKRVFTIRELKRICGFPDDFQLVGSFQKQWARLGNAVPPLMMREIATAIREGVLDKVKKTNCRMSKSRTAK